MDTQLGPGPDPGPGPGPGPVKERKILMIQHFQIPLVKFSPAELTSERDLTCLRCNVSSVRDAADPQGPVPLSGLIPKGAEHERFVCTAFSVSY
ncbi:hypothetical protein EYF80_036157 [Liparis tanakae]|uniref:Uncharacterized protein n=1 Tax=Liparis tanakae TaxID=230148 RepID=A0A4Z2GK32_9TELE|nr:hypothetical protein EYF80_036157 [Liparis tanakae]